MQFALCQTLLEWHYVLQLAQINTSISSYDICKAPLLYLPHPHTTDIPYWMVLEEE